MSVEAQVKQWLAWDRVDATRHEIEVLWQRGDEEALQRLLGSRLAFGTAGLRARMGAGNAQMNHLTVIQTAQGLAAYLKTMFTAEELATRGIALGFDGRHHSREFARLTAAVMKHAGLKTYLYDRVTPTPYVPFAILHFRCVAGVMVTASHNPKQDNGYKVFWSNGAQITSPHDKNIAAAIEANLEPLESSWALVNADVNPFEEIHKAYFDSLAVQYKPLGHAPDNSERPELHFTYSAMHGVGAPFTLKALAQVGVPEECIHSVKEQELPDPDFPTVEFPNPEEGKTSLLLSEATAERAGSTVILANDPDADRLAVAERSRDGASWRVFTGNEIGAMLGWWAVHHAKKRGDDPNRCFFVASIVSSPILGTIAEKEGMHFYDTLTGFKWMGRLAEEMEREGKGRVLLAFEEAIGFMWGGRVYDKDGVTAAGVMADLTRYLWAEKGITLGEQLQEIYETFGYHYSNNSYVTTTDTVKVAAMFHEIATREGGEHPTVVAGAKVLAVRNLGTGLDTREPDHKTTLPVSPKNPIITFYLDNDVTFTIRGSGTEPKLKWYSSLKTSDKAGKQYLDKFVKTAVDELIQPEKYGFARRQCDLDFYAAMP